MAAVKLESERED